MNKKQVTQELNMFQEFLQSQKPKEVNYKSIELDGVDDRDYPDFCDAFITYAEYTDGTPLTEDELEELGNDGYASELAMNRYC